MSPDNTPPPTVAGRLVAGVAFVAVLSGILALREFSRGVASFTRNTADESPVGIAVCLTLTLGPALLSLMVPRRGLVMVAGLSMLPYLWMSILHLLVPPIGLALLLPPFLWYRFVMRPTLDQPLYP